MSSLLTLPDELLDRILDQLDTDDILFSFRNVCTRCYTIANNYNRLKITFTNILSKADVRRTCQIIRPENIVSLTLQNPYSDTDELGRYFLSFDIYQLTRLRSIHLFHIKKRELKTIIHYLSTISTLNFLSLAMGNKTSMKNDTSALFSAVIARNNLYKVELSMNYELTWPNHCTLQELVLKKCTYQQLCNILHHSPKLQTLTLTDCDMSEVDESVQSVFYRQLTSLTVKCVEMSIYKLEYFLSRLPSLVHLDLTTNWNSTFNFLKRFSGWEKFLREKLASLEIFHFYICTLNYNNQDIESIITPFRTLFWLEYKQWFITCRYTRDLSRSKIILYSTKDSDFELLNNLDWGLISYSTSTTIDDDETMTNSEWGVRLNLPWMIEAIASKKFEPTDHQRIFSDKTQLVLDINKQWFRGPFDCPSTLIDLRKLREIWLIVQNNHCFQPSKFKNILEEASNIRTLGIACDDDLTLKIEDIRSVLSRRIDHLKIRMKNVHCMKLLVERIEHVSIVTFLQHSKSPNAFVEMIEWLAENRRIFILADNGRLLQVWLGSKTSESLEIKIGLKRMKLTHP